MNATASERPLAERLNSIRGRPGISDRRNHPRFGPFAEIAIFSINERRNRPRFRSVIRCVI